MKIEPKFLYPVLAFIPLLCLIYYVSEYMVDVPFSDQWGYIPLFEKAYEGTLTFNDLWRQQLEQRPFFPRVIIIQLARLSNWKISYELATNILLSIATFLIITYQIRITNKFIKNRNPCWLIPIISLIIFSLAQNEGWLWGWAMLFFLSVFAVTSGIVVLANFGSKWTGFCSAVFLGILGTYSFGIGLLCWPIGLFILYFINYQDKKNKIFKLILWTATSILIIGSYLYTYQTKPQQPSALFCLSHPFQYLVYVLSYLGSPLYYYKLTMVIPLGLFGLIIFVFTTHNLIKYQNIRFQVLVPYIAIGFFAIGSALLTGIGRVTYGPQQALVSRYITVSSLFWISNIILVYLYINVSRSRFKEKLTSTENDNTNSATVSPKEFWRLYSRQLTSQATLVSIITIVAVLVFINSTRSTINFKKKYGMLAPARNALMKGKSDGKLIKRLNPKPERIKEGIKIMKKYKLSVFRE